MPACGLMESHETPPSEFKTAQEISQNFSGPRVLIELFPVYLSNGMPYVLIPGGEESWQFPMPGSRPAHELVKSELSAYNLEGEIIHSTSWRQDREKLLITYLAVVRKPEKIPAGWEAFPVAATGLVRGGTTSPPENIPAGAVIHHAFQHLAWLFQTDPVVRKTLAESWEETLRPFQAQPARSLGD